MTPVGERLLRSAVRSARRGGDPALVDVLEAILSAEGLPDEPAPPEPIAMTPAERMRKYRAKLLDAGALRETVTPLRNGVTSLVTSPRNGMTGVGGSLVLDQQRSDMGEREGEKNSEDKAPTRARASYASDVTSDVTTSPQPYAADLDRVVAILAGQSGNAAVAQKAVAEALMQLGYACALEVTVDGGRIDVCATKDDCVLGIEIDRATPRDKSQRKLSGLANTIAVCILREAPAGRLPDARGFDIVVGLGWTRAVRKAKGAADDGAFGMAVSAWVEGVAQATGVPFAMPAPGAVRVLVDALNTHKPDGADACEFARRAAADYVRACPGRNYTAFGFADWLNSGRPSSTSGHGKAWIQPAAGATWKIGDGT